MASLAEKLAEYDSLTSAKEVPEAGAGHYLARGALSGISALADALPNLYNLGKAAVGVSGIPTVISKVTGKPASDYMPEVGNVNPIGNFLHEGYGLNTPVRPSDSIGGNLGAAVLEGMGAAVGQGPTSLVKALPMEMVKEVAKQSGKNAVIGGLAGGGAEVGGEATGGSAAGQLLGGVVGGVVAPATFLRKGGLTVGAVIAAMDTAKDIKARQAILNAAKAQGGEVASKAESMFEKYVNSTLKSGVSGDPNAAGNLSEGIRLREQIPGFNPSVAEMANNPGLIDMQRKFALLNPQNLNSEVSRNAANAEAVNNYYRGIVPAPQMPSAVRSSVNQKLADYEKMLSDEAVSVASKLPVADQLATGNRLAEIANSEKNAARAPIQAEYQKAFDAANNTTLSSEGVLTKVEHTVPSDGILSKVEQILGEPLSQIKPANAPQTVSAIRRIFGDKTEELTGRSIPPDLMAEAGLTGKKELTLQDLHDIRVAIGQDVASASRSIDPTAATRLYNLKQVLPEVDAAIQKMPQSVQDAYASATAKYRDEYVPRFKEGSNLRVFKDTSLNEPRIKPDQMVSEYFKTDSQGGITKAMQFNQLFGKNAEAKDAAKIGLLDIYRQKVVNPSTGAIDQSAHNAFLRDYGRTLSAYKSMGIDAVSYIQKIGQEAAKVSASMDSFRSIAKTMKFDTVDELATDALKNPKIMGNALLRIAPDKRATFNAILLDKSFESGTAKGMRDFLESNKKTLSMTVPKEQLSAMQDISKALEMIERAPIRGNIATGGADMLKNASGVSTATVFSQIRAVTGGRSSPEWAAINLAMPALNKMTQTSFANVMESAMHSKESAVALRNYLMSQNPTQANGFAQKLLNSMKIGGKLLWSAKGPIIANFLGPQRYPGNLAKAGSAIESQLQQTNSNE